MIRYIEPAQVRELTLSSEVGAGSDSEYCVIDVREERAYADGHLFTACNMPLSRLELLAHRLIPRTSVTIVVCDLEGGKLCLQAAGLLATLGFTNVLVLRGGVAAAKDAGFELFTGINVLSKTFGEIVETECRTPHVDPHELERLLADRKAVLIDCRPSAEFRQMSIPGAVNLPGAELLLRLGDLIADEKIPIVVNCAGRTRSIIGTQTLRNAGVPNPVFALRNGTMGWHLSGRPLLQNATSELPEPSEAALSQARSRVDLIGQKCGVREVGREELAKYRREANVRSLYILDVRTREEFELSRVPGSHWAAGGQLVQETDRNIAVRNARIVLVDNMRVRAVSTAAWLVQMGWNDTFVFTDPSAFNSGDEADSKWAPPGTGNVRTIAPMSASALIAQSGAKVFDLGPSGYFNRSHIPSAHFTARRHLVDAVAATKIDTPVIVTSEDGLLAALGCGDVAVALGRDVLSLDGGTQAWAAAGLPLVAGPDPGSRMSDDTWIEPYDHEKPEDCEREMRRYLDWEVGLMQQLERDGSVSFNLSRG